jgi:putative restriction endonuclease
MLIDGPELRNRIFADVMAASNGGVTPISRDWLLNYQIDGQRLPLVDAQGRGIRNPQPWRHTLSITTVERGRYEDREIEPGVWRYPYCIDKHGNVDPSNTKLRQATDDAVSVLYFYKPVPLTYLPIGLVTPFEDHAAEREFTIALGVAGMISPRPGSALERAWVAQLVERRLHQPRFRAIVLEAYGSRCAICALPKSALLDAAHIRGDKDPDGQPVVENGLALCSIHHRAYDAQYIGIDEELGLHVRPDISELRDGPVLEYAIQRLAGTSLRVVPPKGKRPDPYRLDLTFKEFLASTN